jgi:DNA-binding protein HU-beta
MTNSKVNRTQLVEAIAKHMDVSKALSERFLSSFIETVMTHLQKGNQISITGFGSFNVVKTAARKGVNPKTRKPLQIPASKRVSFKVGKTLKESVK